MDLSIAQVVDPVCDRFEAAWKACPAFAAPACSGGPSGCDGPRKQGTQDTPPRPRLEDFLGATTGPERAALLRELVLLEIYYRRRCGECPKTDDYRARFPELEENWLATAVTAQAEPLAGSPGVSTDLQEREAQGAERSALGARRSAFAVGEDGIPRRIGEHRILRKIGAGGMGVVYEAVQESLGRHVALKVLPYNPLAGPVLLERFRREAKAAARLHHTNIVPVFGVGEQDGVHYFAMQFIHGQSLDQVLCEVKRFRDRRISLPDGQTAGEDSHESLAASVAQGLLKGEFALDPARDMDPDVVSTQLAAGSGQALMATLVRPERQWPSDPTTDSDLGCGSHPEIRYFRSVARLAIQVADALDYAHRHGVLHRDIKPSNLLLDSGGTVWVTDFGLAKADDAGDLTSPGDVVGTLRYMAPERLEGLADARSDVYGLGATLYELLTLRPTVDDPNRVRLIERVRRDNPVPPRKLDPRIPRDLETITLKAITKEPDKRYATAGELAEDLRRFLADRPIRARRTPFYERAWRWCRRNPALAALNTVVAALLVFVALGSTMAALWLQAAGRQTTEKLYDAYVAQASAGRTSRRVGQRFKSLKAITEAVQVARSLELPEDRFLELRNEAIACLALPDLSVAREWKGGPAGPVRVDFDGAVERYARLDEQGNVSIHRVADNEEIYHFSGAAGATGLYLSPNGQFLFVGSEVWKLWKLAGPEPSVILDELRPKAHDFSPDSRQLAVARNDGGLEIYDLASGLRVRERQFGAEPRHLAFHPTEQRLAIAFEDRVEVRDLDTGNMLARFPLEPNATPWASWRPDGKVLAADGGDGVIYLWDVATGKQMAKLEGTKNAGLNFTFSHAGDLLASTGWEGVVRLWDPRSGKELFHTPALMTRLHFSLDDGLLASEFTSSRLRLWRVEPGREYRTFVRLPASMDVWLNHAVSPDGRLLAVVTREGVMLWDLASGKELDFTPMPVRAIVQFEPSGDLLTNSSNGLWRWPVRARAGYLRIGPPHLVPLPGSPGDNPACSRDGRVMAIPRFWGALVLHTDRQGQPVTLAPHSDVRQVAVSPDGRWVATISHNTSSEVKVWNAKTGKLSKSLFAGVRNQAAFSPNGQWLATGGDAVRVWAVGSWNQQHCLEGVRGLAVAFSPDSRILAFETEEGVVRLVDPKLGKEWARLVNPDQERAGRITFTPDGAQLVITSGDGPSTDVWDLRAIRGHLAAMGLDWDLPAYPAARDGESPPGMVQVERGSPFGLLAESYPASIGLNTFLLKLNPFNWEAYYQRGRKYAMQGESEKAIADYSMALALLPAHDPRRVEVLFRRFTNYYRLVGDKARGLADLQQLAIMELGDFSALHADLAWTLNEIAWQLVMGPEKERNPAQALPLAQRAVTLTTPELCVYRTTLGIVNYRLAQYGKAAEVLQRSLSESSDETAAFDLFFLALSHTRLGDGAKASAFYDQAVNWVREHRGRVQYDKQAELDACWAEARALLGKDHGS
jgi:serine/threonine protein kinase/WD40 repeat protein